MEANVNQALRQLEEAKQFHITMHNSTKVDLAIQLPFSPATRSNTTWHDKSKEQHPYMCVKLLSCTIHLDTLASS